MSTEGRPWPQRRAHHALPDFMTATLTVGRAGWWAGRVEGPRALAGRRQERQTVADMLRGGQGIAALLVVGEAGIGKSRLVEVVAKAFRVTSPS